MTSWSRVIVAAAVVAVLDGHDIAAQTRAFEVASVKVNRSGFRSDPPMARFLPGGRWSVSDLTLRRLVLVSYRLQDRDAPPPPAAVPDGPWLFTALEEQLGLRLTSGRRPVEVLVIDRATRPSAD